jgi:hypothetical protein
MTRWDAGNTLTDASLDDNGFGGLTRSGNIDLISTNGNVNIDGAFVVSGRDAYIGDAFGGSLSIREAGGNFNGTISVDNLNWSNRSYIIPNSNVATTYFLLRDFSGTQTITNGLAVNGRFMVGSSTAPTPFYFASNGSIDGGEDIGSNDAATLYIHNTNNASTSAHAVALVRAAGSSGGNAFTSWDVAFDNGYSMGIDNSDSKLKISKTWDFNVNAPGNVLFTVDGSTGNVGIGTVSPIVRLDVETNASKAARFWTDGTDINGMIGMEVPNADGSPQEFIVFSANGLERGNVTYQNGVLSYNNASDYRLKTDLRDFSGLSLINKIPVYDYAWKADGHRMFGFMAHELQSAVPYLVTGVKDAVDDKGNPIYQMVDYSKLTPILTKAIQEQQTLIDKQQATINDQQERLEKLESLVKELLEKSK